MDVVTDPSRDGAGSGPAVDGICIEHLTKSFRLGRSSSPRSRTPI